MALLENRYDGNGGKWGITGQEGRTRAEMK